MTRHWDLPDVENAPCARCEKPVHLSHDPPCPHGICVCDTCEKPDACPDCRRDAELEMYRSGVYDPVADPFYRPGADDDFNPTRSWRYGLGPKREEKGA